MLHQRVFCTFNRVLYFLALRSGFSNRDWLLLPRLGRTAEPPAHCQWETQTGLQPRLWKAGFPRTEPAVPIISRNN